MSWGLKYCSNFLRGDAVIFSLRRHLGRQPEKRQKLASQDARRVMRKQKLFSTSKNNGKYFTVLQTICKIGVDRIDKKHTRGYGYPSNQERPHGVW